MFWASSRGAEIESGSHKLEVSFAIARLTVKHAAAIGRRRPGNAAHSRTAPPAAEAAPLRFDPPKPTKSPRPLTSACRFWPKRRDRHLRPAVDLRVQSNLWKCPSSCAIAMAGSRSLRQQDSVSWTKASAGNRKFSVVKAAEAAAPDRSGSLRLRPPVPRPPPWRIRRPTPFPIASSPSSSTISTSNSKTCHSPRRGSEIHSHFTRSARSCRALHDFRTPGRRFHRPAGVPRGTSSQGFAISGYRTRFERLRRIHHLLPIRAGGPTVGLNPLASDVSKSLALRVAVEETGDFHTAVQELRDAYTASAGIARCAVDLA